MGRKKYNEEDKKATVSLSINPQLAKMLDEQSEKEGLSKSALIENDTILNKTDWTNIVKGGLLYPEYPCSMVNHKNTIVDFIVYVITVDVSDEV